MQASSWTAGLATGIPAIDSEHFDFVARVERILEGQEGLRTFEGAMSILAYLESFVLHHFVEEEEHMHAMDYPDMLRHRAEHGRLIEYVLAARHQVATRPTDLEVLVVSIRLLCNWLLCHLNAADREFAEFMQQSRHRVRAQVG